MIKSLLNKLLDSLKSVAPISLIVVALVFSIIPVETNLVIKFLICTILLIVGITLFSLGSDLSMVPMGKHVGEGMSRTKKLSFMIIGSLVVGFIITFAEPDLSVLAEQLTSINPWLFIVVVSVGVGIFLMLAVLRIVFQIKLSFILAIAYGIIILLSFFVPSQFLPIALDSGSVTTGPISVPFLISFGLGLSTLRNDRTANDDSFGIIGLCSAGPIITVMLLSLFLPSGEVVPTIYKTTSISIGIDLFSTFGGYLKEVAIVLLPIFIIFILFQIFILKLPKRSIYKIMIGLLYTYFGITIFLTGVNAGYLPIANIIGKKLVELNYSWLLYPLSLIIGYCIIAAEPAVHVLKKQVEDITGGAIKQKTILIAISVGVAISVFVATLIALHSINILWFIIPMYMTVVILCFFNSNLFSAVAFDAGGTATGAMAVSFILPLLAGVSGINAFGTVSIIAIMPIITIQILGLIHNIGTMRMQKLMKKKYSSKVEIINFTHGGK